MDEEKTIDDEKTVDEAVEEMTGDMKEFEPVAFDEAVKETEPERKDAPVLRDGGDPEPADMNMIHKHLDNFLAKIAGETPLDENVRDSTEYWLNRIAENMPSGGGSVYSHTIKTTDQQKACVTIFTTSDTQFTATTFAKWLYDRGYVNSNAMLPTISHFFKGSDTQFGNYCGFFSEDGTVLKLLVDSVTVSPTVSVISQSVTMATITDTVKEE